MNYSFNIAQWFKFWRPIPMTVDLMTVGEYWRRPLRIKGTITGRLGWTS